MKSQSIKNNLRLTIYYDGVCNLCGTIVKYIKRIDKSRKINFLDLQYIPIGVRQMLEIKDDNFSSIIVVSKDKVFTKSSAFMQIVNQLGFPWSLLGLLRIIPSNYSDKIYDMISDNRYKFFSKKSCAVDVNNS